MCVCGKRQASSRHLFAGVCFDKRADSLQGPPQSALSSLAIPGEETLVQEADTGMDLIIPIPTGLAGGRREGRGSALVTGKSMENGGGDPGIIRGWRIRSASRVCTSNGSCFRS